MLRVAAVRQHTEQGELLGALVNVVLHPLDVVAGIGRRQHVAFIDGTAGIRPIHVEAMTRCILEDLALALVELPISLQTI